jgi:hypothetical protein
MSPQQHPDFFCWPDCPTFTFPLAELVGLVESGPAESIRRVLISLDQRGNQQRQSLSLTQAQEHSLRGARNRTHRARAKKASSTLMLFFALASMNRTPSSSANSWPCCSVMTFLSVQSHLFPTRILLTPSDACCSILECQVRMSNQSVSPPPPGGVARSAIHVG